MVAEIALLAAGEDNPFITDKQATMSNRVQCMAQMTRHRSQLVGLLLSSPQD